MSRVLFKTQDVRFKNILRYPDLELVEGPVHFIMGESGCGKSTLLKLFNHALSPDTGQIYYDGIPLEQWAPLQLRRSVSLVSQETWLFPGSIRDNFHEVHRLRGLTPPEDSVLITFCDLCRVMFPLDHDTANLSGGERHRLYIALFLILNPKVILLDEPTAALDEKNTHEVIGNIIQYCRAHQISLIIVSHDGALAEKFSGSTLTLKKEVV